MTEHGEMHQSTWPGELPYLNLTHLLSIWPIKLPYLLHLIDWSDHSSYEKLAHIQQNTPAAEGKEHRQGQNLTGHERNDALNIGAIERKCGGVNGNTRGTLNVIAVLLAYYGGNIDNTVPEIPYLCNPGDELGQLEQRWAQMRQTHAGREREVVLDLLQRFHFAKLENGCWSSLTTKIVSQEHICL